jgi:16S rRNA (cytosine967-C5)-methyltransferase
VAGQKPREIAVRVLQRRRSGREFTETLLERALAQASLSEADRALCKELVFGVVRWQATLDWLIGRKTGGRTQKTTLQDLLRLGLYQIFWLDRIPDHAAVHETVELAKRSGLGPQSGFVNAVLRGSLREFETTKQALARLRTEQPHVGWSHPEWLVNRWRKRWGEERTLRLLEWNNTPPKVYARANTLKADPGRLLEQWREEGVEYDFVMRDWIDENSVFELKAHPPLTGLPSLQQGLFYIQDPGTLLAVRELNPQPGDRMLDLCAAPGGKTTLAAQFMRNEGRIVAVDESGTRLKLLRENCARLGATSVKVCSIAGLRSETGPFDRILVDAPCSNTGVLRRRVDLRWRVQPQEIRQMCQQQIDILRQAAGLLKTGGTLVYSTCSLEPDENAEITKQFLAEHSSYEFENERELHPIVDDVDGAYVARLRRAR